MNEKGGLSWAVVGFSRDNFTEEFISSHPMDFFEDISEVPDGYKVYLTNEGFLEIEEELNELKNVRRPAVIKALKEARALGDLSENADYDAARNEQAQVEGRIQELEKIMENAHIIEKNSNGKVGLGSTVVIKYLDDDDDETEEYQIVGSKEADPSSNKISNESPLAIAIMNAKVGDVKAVESPNGQYDVKIVEVR